jgi:hypothetical protein
MGARGLRAERSPEASGSLGRRGIATALKGSAKGISLRERKALKTVSVSKKGWLQ